MNEIHLIIAAVVVIALGWLLLKFGQAIARFLLAMGGLIVAAIIGLALLEQARATVRVATVAPHAAGGQAATIALIIISLAVGGGAYLYLRHLRHLRQQRAPSWLPGPWAYWGQMSQPNRMPAQYPPIPPYLPPPYQTYWGYPYSPYLEIPEEEEETEDELPPWWA
ncbi:MAG: hypothetical protein ACP5N6_15170 [Anaerolineae bacterium]